MHLVRGRFLALTLQVVIARDELKHALDHTQEQLISLEVECMASREENLAVRGELMACQNQLKKMASKVLTHLTFSNLYVMICSSFVQFSERKSVRTAPKICYLPSPAVAISPTLWLLIVSGHIAQWLHL